MSRVLVVACVASLLAAGPAAAGPRCDAAGVDAAAIAAAREAVAAACACDGFRDHAGYVECARRTTAMEVRAGHLFPRCRNAVARIAKRSACSYRRPRTVCCEERRGGSRCAIRSVARCVATRDRPRTACGDTPFCADADCARGGSGAARCTCTPELLVGGEGNRLRRYDVDTIKRPPLRDDVLVRSAADGPGGRDMNGQICPFPDGSGRFIAGEDTGQPHPPPGWGVFERDGTQVGKLTPTYQPSTDNPENFGCVFDAAGRLFTTDVGTQDFGQGSGQLLLWFPPFDRFPGPPGAYPGTDATSTNFCLLATDISTAGSLAIDEQGRIYVASSSGFRVLRFSPPFPTSPDAAGGCGRIDANGSPLADAAAVETFVMDGANVATPSGIARARNGNWFISSVLTGVIAEYTPAGEFVRKILEPPPGEPLPSVSTGNPQGIAVDCEGDLYYADLALVVRGGIGPGPNGKVRWIHFDAAGNPQPPVVVKEGLAFPDAVGIVAGDLEAP